MDFGLVAEFAKQGLLGLIAVVEAFVILRLYKKNQVLYDRLEGKSDKWVEKYYSLASEVNSTLGVLFSSDQNKKPDQNNEVE